VVVAGLACLAPPGAAARVDLASNARGDQVLLRQVLGQTSRPLAVSARAAGAPFAPLAPVGPAGDFDERALVVDDAGGATVAWTSADRNYEPARGDVFAAAVAPGGQPGDAIHLGSQSLALHIAGNSRGDSIVTWLPSGDVAQYSIRVAGGEFQPPAAASPSHLLGVALDDDGTATFVGFGREGQLVSATKPPGGEIGPERPLPGTAGSLGVAAMGTAPDGTALVVWTDGDTLFASERAPRSDFSEPLPIGRHRGGELPVASVHISPSGAAAIALGPYGNRIVVREPGGPFLPAFTVPVEVGGETTGVTVDGQGDAAVTWHTSRGGVRAVYRAAGSARWPRPVTVARAPRLNPPVYAPPAIALDDSRVATVAWETSDGANVRTYTRTLRGTTLGARVPVDSTPSYFAEGPPSACTPPGARVLRTSKRATVFQGAGGYRFGCLLDRGAPVALAAGEDSFPPATIAFKGPLIAYGYNFFDRADQGSIMAVTDLRDPEFGMNGAARMDRSDYAILVTARLSEDGAVAWISCPDPSETRARTEACRRPGGDSKHVWMLGPGKEFARLLDRGRKIRPSTFRLRGSLLTWRNGRKLRRARLR
jgi:hypothetical protein